MVKSADKSNEALDPVRAEAHPWQENVIHQLLTLQRKQTLPHAILIEIPTRVDSRAFGWQLVTALLCQEQQENNVPCGSCQHCTLMQANSYPDFTFTTLQENDRTHKLNRDIKIEQIRKLIHQLSLTASLRAGKVALIYPAERMNQSAANSLLKTLEEPSADATLILLTHNAARLPVTIRSRCQQWTLPKPTPSAAIDWLVAQGIEETTAQQYLELSRDDVQLARQMQEQDVLPHVVHFREQVRDYLAGRISIPAISNALRQFPEDRVRLMVEDVLLSLLYKQLDHRLDAERKTKLIALLELLDHSQFVLQGQEKNLLIQLQLEDVLISLKQIINQGKTNASTRQPGHTVAEHQG